MSELYSVIAAPPAPTGANDDVHPFHDPASPTIRNLEGRLRRRVDGTRQVPPLRPAVPGDGRRGHGPGSSEETAEQEILHAFGARRPAVPEGQHDAGQGACSSPSRARPTSTPRCTRASATRPSPKGRADVVVEIDEQIAESKEHEMFQAVLDKAAINALRAGQGRAAPMPPTIRPRWTALRPEPPVPLHPEEHPSREDLSMHRVRLRLRRGLRAARRGHRSGTLATSPTDWRAWTGVAKATSRWSRSRPRCDDATPASDARPIVIVGSGLAGYTVARELRKLDKQAPLVVLSRDHAGFSQAHAVQRSGARRRPRW